MKLDIRLYVPGLPFDPNDPYARSLGGSETAGVQLAAAIAELGHRITVFANVPHQAVWRGVKFVPEGSFYTVCAQIPCDLILVQRNPSLFGAARFPAKVTMLWAHDLLFARRVPELMAAAHAIDRVITVSDYQRRQWQEACPELPDSLFLVSRNGLDLNLIKESQERVTERGDARDPKLMVYSSRPERGLDVLLGSVYPKILERDPEAKLAICAYDCPNPNLAGFYAAMQQKAASCNADGKPRVAWLGALSKPDLYDLLHQARVWIYPTPSPVDPNFAETSCIGAMEAMACGARVVTTDRGALPQTVGGLWGDIIPLCDAPHAGGGDVPDRIARAVGAAIGFMRPEGGVAFDREHAFTLSWSAVAIQIVDEALRIMARECSDPVRLARHFIRRQDIEAAREAVLSSHDHDRPDRVGPIWTWLNERFSHTATPETLAAYYETQVGPGNDHVFQALMQAPDSRFMERPFQRFHLIDEAIRRHFKLGPELGPQKGREPLRILDFGCSQGECAIVLHNRLGAQYVGVDASPDEVARARKLADAKAKDPSCLFFICDDERGQKMVNFVESGDDRQKADVAILAEVLEHVADPIALVERIEGYVKPGGLVCITVPYGPWELQQPEDKRGQHLREWDVADLEDIFGRKPQLAIDRVPLAHCPISGEVLGNTHVTYAADKIPLGRINWERKLSVQRPRQTLSAMLLVGGPYDHQTLHWCLESVAPVVDEIVIGDAAASVEAQRIWRQYGARTVDVLNPRATGFEAPRNAILDACDTDWVMMIDSDERLVDGLTLSRYLRENIYHSYSVRQHHFAVDAQWQPDLPGRIFRRKPTESGETMRFYGCLTPDALVATNPGLSAIGEIAEGSFVRTHDGSYRKVTKLWRYETEDELVEIDAWGADGKLRLTKNHEVLAIRATACHYPSQASQICRPCAKASECAHRFYERYSPEWVRADELRKGDILLYPLDTTETSQATIRLSECMLQARDHGKGCANEWRLTDGAWSWAGKAPIPDQLAVDGDLLRLAGYYVSDGNADGSRVSFYFAEHEAEYVEDVQRILSRYGQKAVAGLINGKRMWLMQLRCRPLAEWLRGTFGHGAKEKRAPLWVMRLPNDLQLEFLRGLWRGDGCVSGTLVRYTTASPALAHQVRDLLLRQGVLGSLSWGESASSWTVMARLSGCTFLDWEMPQAKTKPGRKTWMDDRYVYKPILSANRVQYSGPVLDLTVEGNHSYVANGVAVHNCIHEHAELGINKGAGRTLVLTDVHLAHVGYLNQNVRAGRFERNLPMLLADLRRYPGRKLGLMVTMRDSCIQAKLILARRGVDINQPGCARADQAAAELCQDVLRIFRETFLDESTRMAHDAADFYHDAARMLGADVLADVQVAVQRQGVGAPIGPNGRHFASIDDLRRFTAAHAQAATAPLDSRWF